MRNDFDFGWHAPTAEELRTIHFEKAAQSAELTEYCGWTLAVWRSDDAFTGDVRWFWAALGGGEQGHLSTQRDARAAALSFAYLN